MPNASLTIDGTEVIKKENGSVSMKLPSGGAPSNPSEGDFYYDTTSQRINVYNGTAWFVFKGFRDGSSSGNAAYHASELKENGIQKSGIYWINLPNSGPTQVYCDMETDGGGWMLLGFAGSTSGVGNSNHMIFHQIGTLGKQLRYDNTSYSRFDYAYSMNDSTISSQLMWRRVNEDNKILIHSLDEMRNRLPGAPNAGNMGMDNSGSGYPITTMKMSDSGPAGLENKTNGRYETGPSYPGIAWNSTYGNNTDDVGSFTTYLNRRQIVYWETSGPESQSQWFHGSVLSLGAGSTATSSQSRRDVGIYFRVYE
jgi:hypothetical protein